MISKKGFGLIGLLLTVIIVAALTAVVLKQYAGQTRRALSLPGVGAAVQSAQPAGNTKAPISKQPPCDGRLVGNICVPTQVHSSSLDAFEQLNK